MGKDFLGLKTFLGEFSFLVKICGGKIFWGKGGKVGDGVREVTGETGETLVTGHSGRI